MSLRCRILAAALMVSASLPVLTAPSIAQTVPGSNTAGPNTAGQRPTDARSYCDRLRSLDGLKEYAVAMITAAKAVAALPEADPRRKDLARLYAQGIDDDSGSLQARLLERINAAVPRQDAYNQDQVVQQYLPWFAACASDMKTESGLAPQAVLFLNPLGQELPRFYDAAPDRRGDQLRQILIAGGHHGLHAEAGCIHGQRSDHIVCFNAFHHQNRPAHGGHDLMNRLNLRTQIVWHRSALGFVLRVHIVTESFAFCIENTGDVCCRIIAAQTAQHIDHAVNRTGGLALCIAQVRHRMKCAVQITRPID